MSSTLTRRVRRAIHAPRPLPLLAALAAVAAFLAAPSANAAQHRLESPKAAEIARSGDSVRYARVESVSARLAAGSEYWGGDYIASTGERVKIYAAKDYPEDPALGQRWANFLAGLVHGSELPGLTTYLVTPLEVRSVCGAGALACYSDRKSTLIVPGEDSPNVSVEALITHEYGHHVAAHRLNTPWPAVEWGTKRWASYLQVCRNTRDKTMFPGAERRSEYDRNPGEGFAEAYRVLNERRAGIAEAPWDIVSQIFYPDETSLSLLSQDVTEPWRANTSSTLSGAFSAAVKSRSFPLTTPLDGAFRLSVRAPPTGRLRIDLYSASGTRVARSTTPRASANASISTTVCGTRAYRATVTRVAGSGSYRVGVSQP